MLLPAVTISHPTTDRQRKRILLTGDVPRPMNQPEGCHFHPGCRKVMDVCREQEPELKDVGNECRTACFKVYK